MQSSKCCVLQKVLKLQIGKFNQVANCYISCQSSIRKLLLQLWKY